jgi:hypothetical protein
MKELQPTGKHRWMWRSEAPVGKPTMYQGSGLLCTTGQRI